MTTAIEYDANTGSRARVANVRSLVSQTKPEDEDGVEDDGDLEQAAQHAGDHSRMTESPRMGRVTPVASKTSDDAPATAA